MDSSVSPKEEIWFLRVCHHISTGLYNNEICRACHFSGLNVGPTDGSAYVKTVVNPVVSDIRREVAENCALLGCYAASSG